MFVPPSQKVPKKSLTRFGNQPWGRALFDTIAREVDSVFGRQIDLFTKAASSKLGEIGSAINRVEGKIAATVAHYEKAAAEAHLRTAEALDAERKEKKIICQWLNGLTLRVCFRLRHLRRSLPSSMFNRVSGIIFA